MIEVIEVIEVISVLDTTAFSAAMRHEGGMIAFLDARRPGDVAVVPPVVAEIEYGIQRLEPGSRKRELLNGRKEHFLSMIGVLDWVPEASAGFGAIKAALEHTGSMIDDMDIAVAAIARAHGAEVITANLVHFERVEGLQCRHWRPDRS